MTIKEFIQQSSYIHNNKFDYSKVSFKKVSDKITIICPIHGEFIQRVNSHLKGFDCKRCSAEKSNETRKIDFDEFKKRSEEVHNHYEYYRDTYKGFNKKIKIKCIEHGDFWQLPSSHISGSGCPKCSKIKSNKNQKLKTFNKYIEELEKLNFDLSLVRFEEYENYLTKFPILCKKHGKFYKSLPDLIEYGCPSCSFDIFAENSRLLHEDIILRFRETHGDKYDYSKFISHNRIDENIKIICPEHGEFTQRIDNHMNGNGCSLCAKGSSKYEVEISEFIKSLNIYNIIYRKRFDNKEFDIYLPDYNLAIEFNGLMDHSIGISSFSRFNKENNKKNRERHLTKTEIAEKYNIQLLHIYEDSWKNKKDIWKSVIKNKLGKSERIFARKCIIREITLDESRKFLEETHLQGNAKSSIKLGLFYKSELVSVMTFMKSRYNKRYDYEIIRFSNCLDTSIIGGASKLLKYFRSRYKGSIISYANRSWSTGNLYKQLGFDFSHKTYPNYSYFRQGKNILYPREKFQKYKLKNKLDKFDENKTEIQNMLENNYRMIYDSGQLVYILS